MRAHEYVVTSGGARSSVDGALRVHCQRSWARGSGAGMPHSQGLPGSNDDAFSYSNLGLVLQQRPAIDASLTCKYTVGIASRAASGNSVTSTFPSGSPETLL